MLKNLRNKFSSSFSDERHIAPLVILRIAFGAVMLFSILRFLARGWVHDFYIAPKFHFTFYGLDWIKPLDATGMYVIFSVMLVTSILIISGLFYRIAIVLFFLSFTYVELIDVTFYLNHYYFISIMAFLLMLVPAHRYFSLDVLRKPSLKVTQVPGWTIAIFKLQLILIYFFAGLAKINSDWLLEAMPLKLWLPAHSGLPVIGPLLAKEWIAYLFSWFGAFFDLSIGFFLLNNSTRKIAYLFVFVFHILTGLLFKIGMFPYIMILVTIIFFSENFHIRLIQAIRNFYNKLTGSTLSESMAIVHYKTDPIKRKLLICILGIYYLLQVLTPFRYLLYPGKLFWTEEGYRFSWRVMLMEKGGTTFFYVKDIATGKQYDVINSDFLTPIQERMMSTQPDMILQYAHYLKDEYKKKGIPEPVVTVESYVTLNGSGSRPFIDTGIDLSKEKESFSHKKWVMPFNEQ